MQRDYSLLGENGRNAIETGLAAAEWYHSDVSRKDMKALMKRSDGPALRDTAILYGLMICFALPVLRSGPAFGRCHFGSLMVFYTDLLRIRAGMNAGMAPPFERRG